MKRIRSTVASASIAGALAVGILALAGTASVAAQEAEPPSWGSCPEDERVGSVLQGSVVDRATDAALGGAIVRVVGGEDDAAILGSVTADAGGFFRICGRGREEPIRLVASYLGHRSDPKRLTPPESAVRLTVDLGKPAFLLFSVSEAETDRPIEGARIDLRPLRLAGVTDSAGRLGFPRLPPVRYTMRVSHVAYEPLDDTVLVQAGQRAELRVPLATHVHTLEPLTVTVTGRDPYLVRMGFYDRMNRMEEGWFAVGEEVRPYRLVSTLFRFKRELIIQFRGLKVVLVDGRPMRFRGYARLDEIPMHRIRGVEAFRCGRAPQEYLRYVPEFDCTMVLLWTR